MTPRLARIRTRRYGIAARALRALIQNPDDTSQVFRIIEALSDRDGTLERLKKTKTGRELLRDRPELLDTLTDHERLSRFPEGSLGREYVRFLDSEGITAAGLKQASIDGRRYEPGELPDEYDFLRNRMRDTHDLWHVVTGYKGDLVGEASLLAFIFAQTKNPGIGLIVAAALVRANEPGVRRLILGGLLRGLRAEWLPAVKWEKLLALPVERVREQLHVSKPPVYDQVRTELSMARKAA